MKILPSSGLDYIELQNLHTVSDEVADDSNNFDANESTEDYEDEDEEKPRKF